MPDYIVIVSIPGEHGYTAVGPMSKAAAEMFLARDDVEGMLKPLTPVENYKPTEETKHD